MSDKTLTRRTLMVRAAQLPVAGSLLLAAGCGPNEAKLVCADPNTLSEGEKSLRSALHYAEASPDAQKVCTGCNFFTAAAAGAANACGQCMILKGAVNPKGHCNSWSAKQA